MKRNKKKLTESELLIIKIKNCKLLISHYFILKN